MAPFQLHPAAEGHAAFLFDAYEATLRRHVETTWGWDDAFQKQGFAAHHPVREWRIVTVGPTPAGGLHVREDTDAHRVRLLLLLPAFQGRGIGTRLLLQEAERAGRRGKALELKVLKVNHAAKSLYERLGFATVGEDGATFHMRMACSA